METANLTGSTLVSPAEKEKLAFKGIIFDMDGTLVVSTQADYWAWERIFHDYNKTLTFDDYVPLLGVRSADLIGSFLGFPDPADVTRILKEKFDYFVQYVNENPIQPVDGARELLQQLQDYDVKVALATSSRNEKMKLLLSRLDFLQYFDELVTGEMVVNSKPAPDIFLKAGSLLGLSTADCLVFEDGPVGVTAAKAAGMTCVAITETHPADKIRQADLVIDTYKNFDIKAVARRLRQA